LHRNEKSGELNGLLRVCKFTQDDAHIFVTLAQIKEEIQNIIDITKLFYSIFNIKFKLRLGTRPKDFMGNRKD
jgi:threonyl-tRNA synthetase